ncbi:hypothetical protein PAXINDRAFT_14526 [Paxillus involutus ATCC 200175]|uniref:Uncharacterized protein n=1 Tax=Paxillus involutus ATCC 200175 TaxID=664439 RepID=A0A0C9SUB1_PAXIN|nr:hypothetical protein PAXINDRAFT_14526 [Paxillus involutus ATCC 200175]
MTSLSQLTITCEGCRRQGLTPAGYGRHLAQSSNPHCIAIYQQSQHYHGRSSPIASHGTSTFDYFGIYDEEDLEWPGDHDNYQSGGVESEDGQQNEQTEGLLDEGTESDEEEEVDIEDEQGWEPPVRESAPRPEADMDLIQDNEPAQFPYQSRSPSPDGDASESNQNQCHHAGEALNAQPYVIKFLLFTAGAPIGNLDGVSRRTQHTYEKYSKRLKRSLTGHTPAGVDSKSENIWAPFESKLDFDMAVWAKLCGAGSTAFSDLLAVDEVCERLGLSYKNSQELNKIIDTRLPGRPRFQRQEIVVAGEAFDVYFRDILECIRALFGDPEFAPYLAFEPERHYADADHTTRMYHDMHTGKWWWQTQKELEKEKPGATIIPVILSSDKTQITTFRNKSAYPVYMTIGNIPKEIRCKPSQKAHILLAYLPTTRLEHITNEAAQKRTVANLFHACMGHILHPLESAGRDGMPIASGDGAIRRGHPLLACYIGDYPEQVLVCGTKTGECPKCDIAGTELGSKDMPFELRDVAEILAVLELADDDPVSFAHQCRKLNIKAIQHPFWEHLPHANVFHSITPDILHQLYQGLVKHLVAWIRSAFGDAEIDARC